MRYRIALRVDREAISALGIYVNLIDMRSESLLGNLSYALYSMHVISLVQ
jgi:hypothetical protein